MFNTRKFKILGGLFNNYEEIILLDKFGSDLEIIKFIKNNIKKYLQSKNLLTLIEKLDSIKFYTLSINRILNKTNIEDTILIYEYSSIFNDYHNNMFENLDKNINILIVNNNLNLKTLNNLINSSLNYEELEFQINNDNEIVDLLNNKIYELNFIHNCYLDYFKNGELKKFYCR